jgi:hypothetical protein
MEQAHSEDSPEHARTHDRRYVIFAIVMAAVVLAFAAISITVVVLTSS